MVWPTGRRKQSLVRPLEVWEATYDEINVLMRGPWECVSMAACPLHHVNVM